MNKPSREVFAPATRGRIEWIGVRRARRVGVEAVDRVRLLEGRGMAGDHSAARAGTKRQITLVQWEHLPLIARFAGVEEIGFEILRRNLVVSGINLHGLKRRRFRIGEQVVLEGTGDCDPCRRMEESIGRGGFVAMQGHGGVTAKVCAGGFINVGDRVEIDADPATKEGKEDI